MTDLRGQHRRVPGPSVRSWAWVVVCAQFPCMFSVAFLQVSSHLRKTLVDGLRLTTPCVCECLWKWCLAMDHKFSMWRHLFSITGRSLQNQHSNLRSWTFWSIDDMTICLINFKKEKKERLERNRLFNNLEKKKKMLFFIISHQIILHLRLFSYNSTLWCFLPHLTWITEWFSRTLKGYI